MRRSTLGAAILGLCVVLVPVAAADIVVLAPSKDNTLYQSATGSLSNGAGAHFVAGMTNGFEARRAILAFDVSAIPAGSTIHAVELTLHMSMTSAGETAVSLRRTLADWGEGSSVAPGNQGGGAPATVDDATWLHAFYDTRFWANPGGDFAAAPSATRLVDAVGPYTWFSTPELVANVRDWVDNPPANFGWTLVGDESRNGTTKRFDTRDHANPAMRPSLRVEFTPIPEPSSLLLLSALMLGMRGRIARGLPRAAAPVHEDEP